MRTYAREKARSVAHDADDRPVLGVDTDVVLDGRIYGKPENATDAEVMLEELSGRDAPRCFRPPPAYACGGGRETRVDAGHVP